MDINRMPHPGGSGPGPQQQQQQQQPPPPGMRRTRCRHCQLPVWLARADPQAVAQARWRSSAVLLEPHRLGGNIVLTPGGLAVFTGREPGEYMRHNCPAQVRRCKYCGAPVRVLNGPPGLPERLAVLDAEPDPDGPVVISGDGYAVHDPGRAASGERFRWHARHQGGSTAALMRKAPGGAR